MRRHRPVFLPELGKSLKAQREARGWSLRGTASMAARKRIPLTFQVLFRLERGEIKNLDPERLRAVATLYTMSYEALADHYVRMRYGVSVSAPTKSNNKESILELSDIHVTNHVASETSLGDEPRGADRAIRQSSAPSADVVDRLEAAIIHLAELGEIFVDATAATTDTLARVTREQAPAPRRMASGKSSRTRKGRG